MEAGLVPLFLILLQSPLDPLGMNQTQGVSSGLTGSLLVRCNDVQKISKARTAPRKEPVAEFKSTAVLPYVQGVSEPLRCCLEQQGIHTIFKSEHDEFNYNLFLNKLYTLRCEISTLSHETKQAH